MRCGARNQCRRWRKIGVTWSRRDPLKINLAASLITIWMLTSKLLTYLLPPVVSAYLTKLSELLSVYASASTMWCRRLHEGYTDFSCKKSSIQSTCHHQVNDLICWALRHTYIPTTKKPTGFLRGDGKRADGHDLGPLAGCTMPHLGRHCGRHLRIVLFFIHIFSAWQCCWGSNAEKTF